MNKRNHHHAEEEAGSLTENAKALLTATAEVAGDRVAEARKRLSLAVDNAREIAANVRDKAVASAPKRRTVPCANILTRRLPSPWEPEPSSDAFWPAGRGGPKPDFNSRGGRARRPSRGVISLLNSYKPMSLLIPPMLGTLIWVGGSTVGIILIILIIVLLVR